MITITSKEAYSDAVQNGRSIILFSADWCPDCRFIEPFLPELEEEYPEYTFYYVDRDEMIDLCIELNIFGIPSFLAYQNGEETGRYVDRMKKTKQQIKDFIDAQPN